MTNTIISLLASYGEKHQIQHDSQEGIPQERCTSKQLQTIIAALEDTKFSKQDIYVLYIDFKNTFGSIDHARLLTIVEDINYPQDAINLIRNIYTKSSNFFSGAYFGQTKLVHIQGSMI